MNEQAMVCTGFYSMPIGAAATTLVGHIPTDPNGVLQARQMLIRAVGTNANFRMDGAAPTAAAGGGMPLNTSDTSPFEVNNLANIIRFQAIAQSTSGSIEIMFFY